MVLAVLSFTAFLAAGTGTSIPNKSIPNKYEILDPISAGGLTVYPVTPAK
jgi:hypothetical protein